MTKLDKDQSAGLTDYSAVSLDDMWASVSQPDNRTWPQIAAWDLMARTCDDQAHHLQAALTALLETWPARPGSAAEAFAMEVRTLIESMRRDAAAAAQIQPVLADASSEMDVAKARIESLIEQRGQYLAVEQARGVYGTPEWNTLDPATRDLANAPLSQAWREDLHAQATAVMTTADASFASMTANLPLLQRAGGPLDRGNGGQSPKPPSTSTSQIGGQAPVPSVPDFTRRSDLGSARLPPEASNAAILASGVGPLAVEQPVLAASAESAHIDDAAGLFTRSIAPPPRRVVMPQVIGRDLGANAPDSAEAGVRSTVNDDPQVARSASSGPMVAPPVSARQSVPRGRPPIRPGGRAALWTSQRRTRRSDPSDPWSVRQGVPPVIEAPEPSDHNPGPGVIGLDR